MPRISSLVIASVVLFVCAACAAGGDDVCRVGAECASGACSADGHCLPADGDGGGAGEAGGAGGAAGSGGEAEGGSAGSGLCPHDGDGVIAEEELVLAPGLSANLRVAAGATVDTAGSTQPDGSRVWDLSVSYAGDHAAVVETQPIAGAWYADVFEGASYASRLSDADDLLGVFEVAPGKLLLRGVVSPAAGVTRTELTYDPPVVVLDLPLSQDKTWQTSTTVSGLAQGIAAFYSEDYTFDVDAHGVVKTPLGDFVGLRVHSELVRTIGGFPTTMQTHTFMSECYGSVATIVSEDQEDAVEFTSAAEIRRLAP